MFEIFNPLLQIINQKKKFGGHRGAGKTRGGVSYEPNNIDNEINVDTYGSTKKSLGTRYEREGGATVDVLHGTYSIGGHQEVGLSLQ